jgi:di/tricarboxylate transporter
MAATAFLSMWISNTATVVTMVPMALSIILKLEKQFGKEKTHNFSVSLMLGLVDREIIREEYAKLEYMRFEEKTILMISAVTALLWIFRRGIPVGPFEVPGWSQLLPYPGYINYGTVAMKTNPLLLMVPATISASFPFMMPVGTQPNDVVYASGRLRIGEMIRAGIFLNIINVIFTTITIYFLGSALFHIDPAVFPEWGKIH